MSKRLKWTGLEESIWEEFNCISNVSFYRTASAEERPARWLAQFHRAKEAGLSNLHIDFVSSLLGHGWTEAMVRGDYSEALQLTEPFFEHPGQEHADVVSRIVITCQRVTALLYTGQTQQAVDLYQSLLARLKDRPGHARAAALVMCGHLSEYCTDRPADQAAPAALAPLVFDVVCHRSRRVRRAASHHQPREGASYGELVTLLDMTRPMNGT
jgi:hypothetical protein